MELLIAEPIANWRLPIADFLNRQSEMAIGNDATVRR
jgi:hypothetical protein